MTFHASQDSSESVPARISRNVLWTLTSDFAARAASFGFVLLCARALSVADLGVLLLAQSLAQYAWVLGDAVANSAYAAREVARAGVDRSRVVREIYGQRLLAGLCLAAIALAVGFAQPGSEGITPLTYSAAVYFLAYSTYPDWISRGVQNLRGLALGNLLASAALVLLTVTIVWRTPSPTLAFLIWAASFLPGTIAILGSLRSEVAVRPAWRLVAWRRHAARSLIFSLGGVGAIGLTHLPVVLLGWLASVDQVGVFSVGFRIVTGLVSLAGVIWWPVYPVLSSTPHDSGEFRSLFEVFLAAMLVLSLPAAVGLSIFADDIVRLLFGSQYAGAVPILQLTAWALPLYFLATVFEITLLATGSEANRARVYAAALATLAVGSVALIPAWGARGAAVAHLAALVVAAAGFFAHMRRFVRGAWLRTAGLSIAFETGVLALVWIVLREIQVLSAWFVASTGLVLFAIRVAKSPTLTTCLPYSAWRPHRIA